MYDLDDDRTYGQYNSLTEPPKRLTLRYIQALGYAQGALAHMPEEDHPGIDAHEFALLFVEGIDRQRPMPDFPQAWQNVVARRPIDMSATLFNIVQGLNELPPAQRAARDANF